MLKEGIKILIRPMVRRAMGAIRRVFQIRANRAASRDILMSISIFKLGKEDNSLPGRLMVSREIV